jgi:hypothetical protein
MAPPRERAGAGRGCFQGGYFQSGLPEGSLMPEDQAARTFFTRLSGKGT